MTFGRVWIQDELNVLAFYFYYLFEACPCLWLYKLSEGCGTFQTRAKMAQPCIFFARMHGNLCIFTTKIIWTCNFSPTVIWCGKCAYMLHCTHCTHCWSHVIYAPGDSLPEHRTTHFREARMYSIFEVSPYHNSYFHYTPLYWIILV